MNAGDAGQVDAPIIYTTVCAQVHPPGHVYYTAFAPQSSESIVRAFMDMVNGDLADEPVVVEGKP